MENDIRIKVVKIDEQGRMTIPNEEQKKLGLIAGAKVIPEIDEDRIILRKSPTRKNFIKEFIDANIWCYTSLSILYLCKHKRP